MDSSRVAIDVYLDEAGALATMADEVRHGLTATPKRLPPKYFYDERGSWLFERITELPEYYLTRAEQALLDRFAPEIARLSSFEELVELGSEDDPSAALIWSPAAGVPRPGGSQPGTQ